MGLTAQVAVTSDINQYVSHVCDLLPGAIKRPNYARN